MQKVPKCSLKNKPGVMLNTFLSCIVTSAPARGKRCTAWGRQYPSNTGTLWLTPSPESNTKPTRKSCLKIYSAKHKAHTVYVDPSNDQVTSCSSCCVKCQHCLHGHVGEGNIERLKHDLHHALPVLQGVHSCLCQQDRVILWIHAQLLERVMPNLKSKVSFKSVRKSDGSCQYL